MKPFFIYPSEISPSQYISAAILLVFLFPFMGSKFGLVVFPIMCWAGLIASKNHLACLGRPERAAFLPMLLLLLSAIGLQILARAKPVKSMSAIENLISDISGTVVVLCMAFLMVFFVWAGNLKSAKNNTVESDNAH